MIKPQKIFSTWRTIFGNWKYLLTGVIIAILFYSANVLISNYTLFGPFKSFVSLKFFLNIFLDFKDTIKTSSFVSIVIISVLIGMLFSMILYKINANINFRNKKLGFLGSIGVFLGVFVSGCVACGVGLVSLLGLGAGFLAFLPYEGLELSILSILILIFTIFKVTEEMYVCKESLFNSFPGKFK